MRRIYSQTVKELSQFRRDRLTLLLAFFLPFMAMWLYGYATRLESKNITLAVKNYDNAPLSRDYIDTIFANGQFIPAPFNTGNPLAPLDRGEAKASIIIPPEFSSSVYSGKQATIQAVIDATDVNNARVIKNGILATTNYFMVSKGLSKNKTLLAPQIRLWFNPGRDEVLYVVPGAFAVVLWIFPCLLAALAMAREREQGTILVLYASSLTALELILGKALAYTLIALLQAFLIILMCKYLFNLHFVGNLFFFLPTLTIFLFTAVMFGIFAGTRAKTQSVAVQIVATTGFTTALLLSGFIYPLRNITYPLTLVSNIVPARYFVEICRNTFVRGSDWPSQLPLLAALLLSAFFLLFAATNIMRKMQLSE